MILVANVTRTAFGIIYLTEAKILGLKLIAFEFSKLLRMFFFVVSIFANTKGPQVGLPSRNAPRWPIAAFDGAGERVTGTCTQFGAKMGFALCHHSPRARLCTAQCHSAITFLDQVVHSSLSLGGSAPVGSGDWSTGCVRNGLRMGMPSRVDVGYNLQLPPTQFRGFRQKTECLPA